MTPTIAPEFEGLAVPDRPTTSPNPHIASVDGLMALAVLAVILFHLSAKTLPGGFSGVDIFFVISGYVVTKSLLTRPSVGFGKYITGFYSRRIARIYPALVFCLMGTAVLDVLFIPSEFVTSTGYLTGLFAFAGLSNFALIQFNDGYFSPSFDYNPYGHTWSLAVEEQFYLLFPLLLFWLLKSRQRSIRTLPGLVLLSLTAGSFGLCVWQSSHDSQRAYFLLPDRFWELGVGAVLSLLHQQRLAIPKRPALVSSLGCALMLFGLISSQESHFPFPWALLAVGGAGCFVAASLTDLSFLGLFFGSSPVSYLGRLSYSLYLWHFPIIVFCRWTVGMQGILPICLAVLATFAAASFSYHFVEPLGRKLLKLRISQLRWVPSLGCVLLIVAFGLWRASYKNQTLMSLSVTKNQHDWFFNELADGAVVQGAPGKVWSGKRLFVIGDSHALAYGPMLRQLAAETGVTVFMHNKVGCAVENLLKPTKAYGPECAAYVSREIPQILAEANPHDLVFLASLRMKRFNDGWEPRDIYNVVREQMSPPEIRDKIAALAEASRVIGQFQSKGITVLIDAPKPLFPAPAYRCADWYDRMNPICVGGRELSRSFLESYRANVMKSLTKLQREHSNLQVWDPFQDLCERETCSSTFEGKPLFSDEDHLSNFGNRFLFPYFVRRLEQIWPTETQKG